MDLFLLKWLVRIDACLRYTCVIILISNTPCRVPSSAHLSSRLLKIENHPIDPGFRSQVYIHCCTITRVHIHKIMLWRAYYVILLSSFTRELRIFSSNGTLQVYMYIIYAGLLWSPTVADRMYIMRVSSRARVQDDEDRDRRKGRRRRRLVMGNARKLMRGRGMKTRRTQCGFKTYNVRRCCILFVKKKAGCTRLF